MATTETAVYEQTLVNIARTLPPERVTELVDFARFLQAQSQDDEWDELLARPQAQAALLNLAREAREDRDAGRVTDIAITQDGRLVPA